MKTERNYEVELRIRLIVRERDPELAERRARDILARQGIGTLPGAVVRQPEGAPLEEPAPATERSPQTHIFVEQEDE